MKSVCVIGLGYVGLPTAVLIADNYETVLGVDIKQDLIEELREGRTHIDEPGLQELLCSGIRRGTLSFSNLIQHADTYIIAVPTPFKKGKSDNVPVPDMTSVMSVVSQISPLLKKGDLIILESTSPVGTTVGIAKMLQEQRKDLLVATTNQHEATDIHLAYCPERVLPGNALNEVKNNARVIGGLTNKCASVAKDFYRLFVDGDCVETVSAVAETVKLTENAYRDVNIAFANELSLICKNSNISSTEVIRIANMHPRVNILQPGVGVGGHCIAVDPWFLINKNLDDTQLMHTARKVNKNKTIWVLNDIKEKIIKLNYKKKDVILYGLAYKPDIGDLRESPSVEILKSLKMFEDIKLSCVEPNISNKSIHGIENISIASAQEKEALHIVLVPHKTFSDINFANFDYIDYR